ncbi:MAG TPA: hypothetical protein VM219_07125 [Phycisphaerae bacterium]|nr:hypothetical protein [Phycisphaerae bacterium]
MKHGKGGNRVFAGGVKRSMSRAIGIMTVILLMGGCTDKPPEPTASIPASRLACIHLQDGFDGSTVHLVWRGETVYAGQPKTNDLLGLAAQIEFDRGEHASGPLVLKIGALSFERFVNWNSGRFVGLSIDHGNLRLLQNDTGWGYD